MAETVAASWNRIVKWLRANAAEALENVQPPATPKQLSDAAATMGLELPEDLRAFYLIADGAESSGIFPSCESYDMAFSPLPLEEVVYGWKMHKELLETGNFPGKAESDPGIAPAWWHVGWIPFAGNGGGDFFCIDTVPTAGGTRGQVIAHSHESGKRVKLADSLSAYLSQIAGGLESNALKYDETYGLQAAAEDDDE